MNRPNSDNTDIGRYTNGHLYNEPPVDDREATRAHCEMMKRGSALLLAALCRSKYGPKIIAARERSRLQPQKAVGFLRQFVTGVRHAV